jgi:SRSO17 transposase
MEYRLDGAAEGRLKGYFERIGEVLDNKRQREAFAVYALGLLGDGERKSAEPMAARAVADPDEVYPAHQRLTYFTRSAPWSDRDVRRLASNYAVAAMTAVEPITSWIIDDTGFLKQGGHSVGVQRQYTGSAGKITNCQVGVSLSIATKRDHAPIDFELYLPESWINDPIRRAETHIPADVAFKTKPEQALEMIGRAVEDGVPKGTVLADSAYGDNAEFRRGVRALDLDYAVGIHRTTTVWRLDRLGRRYGDPVAVGELAVAISRKGFRRVTWRNGTKVRLASRFAAERVVLAQDDGVEPSKREAVWLLMEWPESEDAPTDFTVATLPANLSRCQLVRQVKERWRTERAYQDAKGELGLDHYEGRTFRGWHHHVSVVLCCFAFIVAERVRAIPPSAAKASGKRARPRDHGPLKDATRAPFRRLLHNRPTRGRTRPVHMATTLSPLPPTAVDVGHLRLPRGSTPNTLTQRLSFNQ